MTELNKKLQNSLHGYDILDAQQLSEVDGGILIAGGIVLAGGGGFAAGYGLSRWLG
mgnify:CR=1 FL=1